MPNFLDTSRKVPPRMVHGHDLIDAFSLGMKSTKARPVMCTIGAYTSRMTSRVVSQSTWLWNCCCHQSWGWACYCHIGRGCHRWRRQLSLGEQIFLLRASFEDVVGNPGERLEVFVFGDTFLQLSCDRSA